MAILPIYEEPHPILKKVAAPIEAVTDEVRTLIRDMAETMYAAPGVGLAAPQVGHSIRLLVADWSQGRDEEGIYAPGELVALINPVIVSKSGDASTEEGCLSIPEMLVVVPRAQEIVVQALDKEGHEIELILHDFAAIVVQHEMDHLEGVTLLDKISTLKRNLYLKRRRKDQDRAAANP